MHRTTTYRRAGRFLAATTLLAGVGVAAVIDAGAAHAAPGECVTSGFGGWCDYHPVDPVTGTWAHCEWGGFIVYTSRCFQVRPVPLDVDPRGWQPA